MFGLYVLLYLADINPWIVRAAICGHGYPWGPGKHLVMGGERYRTKTWQSMKRIHRLRGPTGERFSVFVWMKMALNGRTFLCYRFYP